MNKTMQTLALLFVLAVTTQLFLLYAVFNQSYEGRKTTVHNQLDGCKRSVVDRKGAIVLAKAQRAAAIAVAQDPDQPRISRAARVIEVAAYSVRITELEQLVPPIVICEDRYKEPSPWPWASR